MKYGILFLPICIFVLGLVGCSGSPKKADTSGKSNTQSTPEPDTLESEATSESAKKDEVAPTPDVAEAKAVSAKTPVSDDRYKMLSRALQTKNEALVLENVAKILGTNPGDVKTWNALGAFYLQTERPQMARIAFRRGLEFDKNSAAIYNNIGLSYLQDEDVPRAVDSFKQALNVDPNNIFASANLGSVALQFGNFARAKELLQKAYDKNSKNESIAFNYARASAEVSDFDTSVKILDGMVTTRNRNPLVYFVYGSTLALQKKDLAKAKQILNKVKVLTSDPAILKATDDMLNKLATPATQGSAT